MNKNLFMAVNIQKMVLLCAFSLVSISLIAQQGGDGRTGEAGASQLLINPWGQSSGMAGANTASAKGVESMFLNVAGLSRTESTELTFAQSTFSECLISGFGFSQKLGEGVLGFSVFSIDFGDIDRTTYDNPDGTLGTYSAQFANLALSYSYQFSYNMSAGITTRMISQNAAEVAANSLCVDAGVHYQTGRNNQAKFGITLKNWGPRVSFGGDGDDVTGIPSGRENEMTLEYRSAPFEIPTLINIGGSYDFFIYTGDGSEMFRLTVSETFVSNSFSKEVVIDMLNKRDDGQKMVFSQDIAKVSVGDTIKWLPTDKGHNVEFIKGGGAISAIESKYNISSVQMAELDVHLKERNG